MKKNVKVGHKIGLIPQPRTIYWYIRACMQTHCFKVVECEWIGCMSDLLRLAKGNVFLVNDEADQLCDQLNHRLHMLTKMCENEHQQEFIKEEAARKKAEAAERKRIREAEKKKLEREAKKKAALKEKLDKKMKNSPHPDVIV